MNDSETSRDETLAERQRHARDEWRKLCDVMEHAQGDELAKSYRSQFQFIKTYQLYGSQFDNVVNRLKQAAKRNDYTFFREHGVPSDLMDWRFAEQLLKDWQAKIRDKKRRLAEIYQLNYGEPIDTVVRTDEDAFRLNSVEPMHSCDAFMQLSGMSRPAADPNEVVNLREEVRQLRQQLEELTAFVQAEFAAIKGSS